MHKYTVLKSTMINRGLIIPILFFYTSSNAQNAARRAEIQEKFDDWRFKDFIQKFDPRTVWEKVERLKTTSRTNLSVNDLEMMFQNMDETDDLLKLNVQRIGPPPKGTKLQSIDEMIKDSRRYRPLPGFNPYPKDRFDLRVRVYELMKQAIYQARNEMVIMQIMRDKYRESPLYKMGFLMSKTDNAVKTFYKFAYRAFRQCGMSRVDAFKRNYLYDILLTEERLLHLWFNAQLLIDLVVKNDDICKTMLKTVQENRLEEWEFED